MSLKSSPVTPGTITAGNISNLRSDMKLLLTSEGITNASIARALEVLLGKPLNETRVSYVPTAANVDKDDKSGVELDMRRVRDLGVRSFEVIDISVDPKEKWLPSFEQANLIAFGGGVETYLLDCLEKSGVQQKLADLLKTRVYLGLSAGSMATAKTIALRDVGILYYDKEDDMPLRNGLGFVDFEIRPHLNNPGFPKVRVDYLEKLARENPTPFYALDDASAVKVDGDKITVVSEGEWKKFH